MDEETAVRRDVGTRFAWFRPMSRTILIPLLALVLPWGADADTLRYGAELPEVAWKAASSEHACSLAHDIPAYGQAVFSRTTDAPLTLLVEVKRGPGKKDQVTLRSVPPAWKPGTEIRELGTVRMGGGKFPFMFGHKMARRLLAELEQGKFPTLFYDSWPDGRDSVVVSLSPVNFKAPYENFLDCTRAFEPVDAMQFSRTVLYFGPGASRMGKTGTAWLINLAEALQNDTGFKHIAVSGFTDNVGQKAANKRLSQRRADSVKDFLVSAGIPAAKVKTAAYGESRPRVKNRTAADRAKNRRVEIKVVW